MTLASMKELEVEQSHMCVNNETHDSEVDQLDGKADDCGNGDLAQYIIAMSGYSFENPSRPGALGSHLFFTDADFGMDGCSPDHGQGPCSEIEESFSRRVALVGLALVMMKLPSRWLAVLIASGS